MSDKFKYRTEVVKLDTNTGRWLLNDLFRGNEDWELVTILPLPQPDKPGILYQTAATAIFKRPA